MKLKMTIVFCTLFLFAGTAGWAKALVAPCPRGFPALQIAEPGNV